MFAQATSRTSMVVRFATVEIKGRKDAM
jgi:hypothetical protein